MRIRFNKIDGFTGIYDGTRYLTLFASESYDATYNRIRYLRSLKSSIIYIFPHYDSLLIEKFWLYMML